MDLWSLLQVVVRRWYIVLPILALTAFSAVAISSSIPPEYEVSGAVLLVGPATAEEELLEADGPDNRLLQLSGSLGTVSQALGFTLDSQRVRSDIEDQGLLADYEIGTDSRSPIMQFLVTGDDPVLVASTLETMVVFVEQELIRAQDDLGTPLEDRIELQRLSTDNEPVEGVGSRRRAQIFLVAVGVLTALATAVAVDALMALRARRRQAAEPEATPDPLVVDAEPVDHDAADDGPVTGYTVVEATTYVAVHDSSGDSEADAEPSATDQQDPEPTADAREGATTTPPTGEDDGDGTSEGDADGPPRTPAAEPPVVRRDVDLTERPMVTTGRSRNRRRGVHRLPDLGRGQASS